MPMKQVGRKTYKSMQGRSIDMDLLRQKNELTPAVGNAKVNARGDELGPGGKIVKTREQVLAIAKSKDVVAEENDALVIEDEWLEDDDGNFVTKEK
jgi:hypothetical protein